MHALWARGVPYGMDAAELRTASYSGGVGGMATAVLATAVEPLGIVIQDGGEARRPPRILMWLWASEEEATKEEEWRER